MANGDNLPIARSNIIWEKCWDIDVFGENFRVCLRIVQDSGTLFAEIEAGGQRVRVDIADTCYTVFTLFGFIEIKLCLSDTDFQGGQLRKVCFEVKACAPIVGCNTVIRHCVNLGAIAGPVAAAAGRTLFPIDDPVVTEI